MSGHSHAANIKHRKAATDAKKGREFSRWAKAIMIAVKNGGKEVDSNLTLKYALEKARAANMPKDTIDRCIKKGAGELPGQEIVEIGIEGIGPGGVSVLVECVTDNRNRTGPEIRKIFEQKNGRIGNTGSVSWKFERKGIISVAKTAIGEDELMGLALDAGADDMQTLDESYEISCAPQSFFTVKKAVEAKVKPDMAEVMAIPKTPLVITDAKAARKILDLIEALEEHDDVKDVVTDSQISDEVAAAAKDVE